MPSAGAGTLRGSTLCSGRRYRPSVNFMPRYEIKSLSRYRDLQKREPSLWDRDLHRLG
jgi:hypothetical protein